MPKMGNKVVFGIYQSKQAVESAIDQFKSEGFRTEDISVLLPERSAGQEYSSIFQDFSASSGMQGVNAQDLGHVKATKAPEGANAGGWTGVALGGALGWLVGAGALAVTGLGPLIAAGPIMGALAGAGVGGAIGGLAGGLIGMGIPEYEAKRFESRVKEGGILLSVHADDNDWVKKAKDLMERTGAEDISSTTEESSGDRTMGRDQDLHRDSRV